MCPFAILDLMQAGKPKTLFLPNHALDGQRVDESIGSILGSHSHGGVSGKRPIRGRIARPLALQSIGNGPEETASGPFRFWSGACSVKGDLSTFP